MLLFNWTNCAKQHFLLTSIIFLLNIFQYICFIDAPIQLDKLRHHVSLMPAFPFKKYNICLKYCFRYLASV